jgi:DNA-directed RNA polymerase specialized sigma24 family protein
MANDENLAEAPQDQRENLTHWSQEFLEITNPKTSTGRLIYGFIRRELTRFNLQNRFSENHVLSEVFIRGHNKIDAGGTIQNINGWSKGTAYRIIRELSRGDSRFVSLEANQPEDLVASSQADEDVEEWKQHFSVIREAFTSLPALEQRLLYLKIVERRPWSEVQVLMQQEGFAVCSESCWRKRKERALSNLRKKYHQIHQFKSF